MSYRELATRPVLAWSAAALGARLPNAMAPLALVFLVRERPGGYGLGAVLAAVYIVAEVAGAAVLGPRLRPARARRHLTAGLAVGAAGFAGLGLFSGAHPAVLGAFAAVAGGGPAAVPGGLRVLLTSQLPERLVPKALGYDMALTSSLWALAPALTVPLALHAAPYAPLLLAAALLLGAPLALLAQPAGWAADAADRGGASMLRTVARAWPVYVISAAAISMLAVAELVLPALLEQRGIGVGWSGPLLAGFCVASAVGSVVYGLRGWPGRLATQSLVLVGCVMMCVTTLAVVPSLAGIAAALLLAGLLQAGALLARNLGLREALPPSAIAAGYSVLFASAGVGYGLSALLSSVMLSVATPAAAVLAGVGLTAALIAIAAFGEHTGRGRETARGEILAKDGDLATRSDGAAQAPSKP